jgi:hypothetical protein
MTASIELASHLGKLNHRVLGARREIYAREYIVLRDSKIVRAEEVEIVCELDA